MRLTHGSLFAGIGGFDLGFEWTGIETLWQVEIDKYCRKVLAKHWPNVEQFKDIKDCGKHNLKSVNIISGGFPCQPFSVAGKRKGTKDDRYLWPEMLRVVSEIRPSWVVAENVFDLKSMAQPISDIKVVYKNILRLSDSDHYEKIFTQQEVLLLRVIIKDLQGIGYELPRLEDGTPVVWCVPAASIDAPHLRKRIWILAYSSENGWRSSELSTKEGCEGETCSETKRDSEILADTDKQRCKDGSRMYSEIYRQTQRNRNAESFRSGCGRSSRQWHIEPDVGRVAHGIPSRVDRLKGLGNAIVPQIAEIIGRMIIENDRPDR